MPEVRWRKRLPDAVITTPAGDRIDLAQFKQRNNIVLLLLPDTTERSVNLTERLTALVPEMSRKEVCFVAGLDRSGMVDPSVSEPVLLIADRFGLIFHEIRGGDEILSAVDKGDVLTWLDFIDIQCGECGNPEW